MADPEPHRPPHEKAIRPPITAVDAVDPLAVGRSLFAGGPVPPVVEGYSDVTWHAEGGFGTVWRARRTADGVTVALKVPQRTDAEMIDRIDAEAEALRQLDHPAIVKLLDVTLLDDGAPVLVMEFVEGDTLTASLPAHGFDFSGALDVLLPVLDAVEHAHGRGILHRDLKPSNILLARDGAVKVTDFGLAQPLLEARVAFTATKVGVLAGTVEYIAPERYETVASATVASDVFALGVILHELLTGRPPRGAWRRVSQVRPLDVRLDEIIADAMHPDPARRLGSVAELRRRLVAVRDSPRRLAGTPLFSLAVRRTDFLWTVGGFYALVAGFCSIQRVNNTNVPAAFDLTFGHTRLLGGYFALWTLCVLCGLLWAWQAVRLWRFRRVPLRESLPSPFGIRFGATRGAVWIVMAGQLLCAWWPLAYMVLLFSQCWFWHGPDTYAWDNVLAVMPWNEDRPVSPWTADVAGMFSGDDYYIYELRPGHVESTWLFTDRQSFFVFTQPLAMVLGAGAICLGAAGTLLRAVLTWRGWRRAGAWALVGLLALAVYGALKVVWHERDDWFSPGKRLGPKARRAEMADRQATPLVRAALEQRWSVRGADAARLSGIFASQVTVADGEPPVDREVFIQRWCEEDAAQGVTRTMEMTRVPRHGSGPYHFLEAIDHPDGRGEFAFCRLMTAWTSAAGGGEGTRITHWQLERTPLASAQARQMTVSQAGEWMDAFLATLSAPGCPGLEGYFHPVVATLGHSPRHRRSMADVAMPREGIVNSIRRSREAFRSLTFTRADEVPPTALSGARIRLRGSIRKVGVLTATAAEVSRILDAWELDLMPDGRGAWRLVTLRF